MSTILVVTEILEGAVRSVSHQVYTAAVQMGRETGQTVTALMLGGGNLEALAETPGTYGVAKTVLVEDPKLEQYSPDCYAAAIAQVAQAQDAGVVLMGASVTGKDLMARVAQVLDAALAQDCISFRVDGGAILFTRPLFAGKVLAEVRVTSNPVLATIRPKAYKPEDAPVAVTVEHAQVDLPEPLAVVAELLKSASKKLDVTEADIVVSGGRGLQGPENWGVLEALADVAREPAWAAPGPSPTTAGARTTNTSGRPARPSRRIFTSPAASPVPSSMWPASPRRSLSWLSTKTPKRPSSKLPTMASSVISSKSSRR